MTATTLRPAPNQGSGSLPLRQRRLPGWVPYGLAVGVVAIAAVSRILGLGTVGATLLAALLYVVALTAVSAVYEGGRVARDRLATALVTAAFVAAVLPLFSVLGYTIVKGVAKLSPYFFLHSMRNVGPRDDTGGMYHAVIGTIEQVGLASLIAIPVGVLTAIYLVEYGRGRLATVVTFFVDVMTGVPSIVAGLFILAFWVLLLHRGFSGFAGSLALAILMLPVVVRSCEEMLKLVPHELREASLALGVPRWKTILRIVLPTALTGIVTGIMLAVARVTGETAPLLLTVLGNDSINPNPFSGAQSAIPLFVYQENAKGLAFATSRAWAAALTLIFIVLVLNLVARGIARWTSHVRS